VPQEIKQEMVECSQAPPIWQGGYGHNRIKSCEDHGGKIAGALPTP